MNFADFGEHIFKLARKNTSLISESSNVILGGLAVALNRMSFTRAGLTIRKNGTVVSLETTVDDWLTQLLEHLILCYVLICDVIKGKFVFRFKSDELVLVNVSYTPSFSCRVSTLNYFLTLNRMV